jgi:hypothetical protein
MAPSSGVRGESMKHARERSEARELPKSAKLRQDATGWARVKERRRRLRERPRGGKEHRLLLLSQKSGVFPDAGGDAGPRRVKEQVFRTRHGDHLLPDISWRAHLLLLGVLRPGAGISSQVAGTPAGRHRFPVRRDFLSPKRMPPGIRLEFCFT